MTILIVGGGLAGITAALALQRAGRKVAVFEQARTIGDVGAGISIGATASRGLSSLGLAAALNEASDTPLRSAAFHYQTGEILGGSFEDRKWNAKDLAEAHLIHRADLFALLLAAVRANDPEALRLGQTFQRFEQDADGVTAFFDQGGGVRGEALIGADGIRSTVREQMYGGGRPRFAGRVVYRFLVPMEAARPFLSAGMSGTYVAPGSSLLRYPVRHETVLNCVAFAMSDAWEGEGWSERVPNEELLSLFPGWHPDVRGLARAAPYEGTAKWALFDRDPMERWVEGRVALLGDAAHPMLPFLGLGAAMGIEDAVVLGRTFAKSGAVGEALALYQDARLPRANAMLLESRRQGEILRAGPESRELLQTTYRQRMSYDPATAPL